LVWLVGIVVGAIHLRPEKVEIGGLSYIIDSPEKLQGIIYVGCLVYYLGMVGNALLHGVQNFTTNFSIKRRAIYAALGKKRTLLGLDKAANFTVRASAKIYYVFAICFMIFVSFLPVVHIVFFQQPILLTGIDAIFQTVSVKDGQIDPNAPVTLILSLLLMIAWTVFLARVLKRFLSAPGGWDIIFLNSLAALSFAYLDSYLRTHEPFTVAIQRAIGLQTTIVLLMLVPKMLVWPFKIWFGLHLWYVKSKVRRAQKKGRRQS
jgi:hypothetical protein